MVQVRSSSCLALRELSVPVTDVMELVIMSRKDYTGKHRDPNNLRAGRRKTRCTACDGSGVYADYNKNKLETCPVCRGEGKVSS